MSTRVSIDKSGHTIRRMFAGVASRYDFLNHLLSGGFDILWRKRLAREIKLPSGADILDLCAGTGDQAIALGQKGYQVVAADFCLPMVSYAGPKFLKRNLDKLYPMVGDAMGLPFDDRRFDGATVSFGLRNVADLDTSLQEMARVLRPGGKLSVLEFAIPTFLPLKALYLFYFRNLLPFIGKVFSMKGSAYEYLPASVLQFPQREDFLGHLRRAGFDNASFTNLTGGIVCLYHATRRD